MEAFNLFKERLHQLKSPTFIDKNDCIDKIEETAFQLCLTNDVKLNDVNGKFLDVQQKLNNSHEKLLEKSDDLIKMLKRVHELEKELATTKESSHKIIRCLNLSLKTSSNLIARTIIETIIHEKVRVMDIYLDSILQQFCVQKGYTRKRWGTLELINKMQESSFWKDLDDEKKEDICLQSKWYPLRKEKKRFNPVNDVLKLMLKRFKTNDMALILEHPKYGTMTESRENIEKSFENLYKTLSEIVHTGNYHFNDDVLPIPDIREPQFNKCDMLALALFYKMNLPYLQYEITTTIDYEDEPFNFLTNINNEKNNTNNIQDKNYVAKRKKTEQNEENDLL